MTREEALRKIAEYRDEIDALDRRLVELLNERTRIVERLGEVKEELGVPVHEPRREDDVLANVAAANHGPLPAETVKRLFEQIVEEMRSLQNMGRENRKAQR